MFRALRRRFVLIYSLSIFLLILFSFSLIFYSAYSNIQKETNMRLGQKDNKLEHSKPDLNDDTSKEQENQEDTLPENPFEEEDRSDISIFGDDIYILLDENLECISVAGQETLDEQTKKSIKEQIVDQKKQIVAFNDKFYAYTIDYKDQGAILKLLNITNSINVLKNLLLTLIITGIIINLLAIIIGNIFASKALKPVKDSYDKQKTFVSDASHEIKTPISVISTCLDLIKDGDDESPKWIDYCISETKRLKKLTENLLTLSKPQTKVNIQNIKKINISEQTEMLICVYEVKLFEEKFKLETQILENVEINFLEDDFKQLFHILMDNAIKYNTDDKSIKITLDKEDKYAVIKIINNSEKIKDGEIDKVFDRFYRQDKVRSKQIEGFGLGLSLAVQILEKYNAKYKVKYESGMFIFEIKFLI